MLALSRSLITNVFSRQGHIHTATSALAAEKSPLFILRRRTGLAYSLCREALNKHENDVEEAEGWLKAHAMAHGLQRASKVRDRSTREGLVCLSLPKDNSLATILEINCETDFVAKNQLFKDFALDITEQLSKSSKDSTNYKMPDQDAISSSKPNEALVKDIENQIVPMITKLGENIKLTRAIHLQPGNDVDCTKLFGQIHAQTASKNTDQYDIMAGRFGAIVALQLTAQAQTKGHDSIRSIGNRLCQHVIGYNPSYIELPANVRKHLEAIEEEKSHDRSSDAVDQTPSDSEGEEGSRNYRDEWPSIMDQSLIMTDDIIVRDFCKANGISIVYFTRLECGIEYW